MTQASAILEFLKDGEVHTVPQIIKNVYKLNKPASARVGARIYDLKQQGHDIMSYHIGGSTWAYQLITKTVWKAK